MIHDKTIRVGACEWDHPQWLSHFYPDDLPEDWRLTYYANVFSTVLVPEAKWQAENVDFEQWAEDVPDSFRFYFLSENVAADDAKIKAQLGDLFAGFVAPTGNDEIALRHVKEKNLREWKAWLLQANYRVIFFMDDDLRVAQLSEFKSLVELMGL
ncbi:hypothetical protein MNBD_GAMMA08-2907 [hydrothermal vent metagenome]|uniref:DUF72 domain-containing protein n=1 Tax=hydrothermal vent metagenome TaxID=652676 RepID=A0A3B0XBM2_9ZZZZ